MEHTAATVPTTISFHQVLNALDQLAQDYPCERLAIQQIERIETAARLMRDRLAEYKVDQQIEAILAPIRKAAEGAPVLHFNFKQQVWK